MILRVPSQPPPPSPPYKPLSASKFAPYPLCMFCLSAPFGAVCFFFAQPFAFRLRTSSALDIVFVVDFGLSPNNVEFADSMRRKIEVEGGGGRRGEIPCKAQGMGGGEDASHGTP